MADPLSRRRFLAASLGVGFSIEAALACGRRRLLRPPALPPCPPPGPDTAIRVRPDILGLSEPQLASLRRGVDVMRKLPATDRRSWTYQAAIHGTTDPSATDPLFSQCQHGTPHFLPWHRGYLHFFERILRWASGDPSLMLPFWDWTADPVLPAAFRDPATAANPLYEARRKANDASALPQTVVGTDLDTALGQTAFPAAAGADGFSPDLEGSPHGAVHTLVGGVGGLMSAVPTAAGDPVFWLHHANIDRLWDVWLNRGGGRASPADAAYLDVPYTFADETGGTATVRVRDVMTSAALGYAYAGVPNPATRYVVQEKGVTAAKAAPPRAAATSSPADAADAPLGKVEAKPLGFKPRRVTLNTVKDARAALVAALPGCTADPPKVTVVVEGLSADAAPDFVYRVYLNLPEGERSDEGLARHYLGSINFFGKTKADRAGGGHEHAAGGEFAASFDATKALAALHADKRLDPDALTVTILPAAPIPPGSTAEKVREKAAETAKQANVSFKRVSVRVGGEK